jgi:hypothetical protein
MVAHAEAAAQLTDPKQRQAIGSVHAETLQYLDRYLTEFRLKPKVISRQTLDEG